MTSATARWPGWSRTTYVDAIDPRHRDSVELTHAIAFANVAIMTNGEHMGWIAVGVTHAPERLQSETTADRLRPAKARQFRHDHPERFR